MTPKFSRAAVALLALAAMSSGCAVDASALARLLANSGVATTPRPPVAPDPLGEPGGNRPGLRPGLRRPVPTPPPQVARPEPMPLPPLPEPWVAPIPEPQRLKGALAFLPDQPVGPAALRALAALAELEAEFNLSTLTLLERPEIRMALGSDRAPWQGDGMIVADGSNLVTNGGPGGLISNDSGGLVANLPGQWDPNAAPYEGDDAEAGASDDSGDEGGGLISNHGGVLVSNNQGSAIVRLPAAPAAGRRLTQAGQRDAALVVVGPIAQILIQVVNRDRGAGKREGQYDFPSQDGRGRRLSYRLEGQALVLTWVSRATATSPAVKLERRVEYLEGVWFHSVQGDLGGMQVSYTIEDGHGGGGYFEGPEGYVGFTAVDPSQPAPGWSEPYPGGEPEPYPGDDPMPYPGEEPEPYPGEEPGVAPGWEGPDPMASWPPPPPPPPTPRPAASPTPTPSVRPAFTPSPVPTSAN